MNRYKRKKYFNKNDSFWLNVSWTQTVWPANYLTVDLGDWYYLYSIAGGDNSQGRVFLFRDLIQTINYLPGASYNYGGGTTPYISLDFQYGGSQSIIMELPKPILTRGFRVGCTSLTSVAILINIKRAVV
jgi:hypothetical protein